MKSICIAITTFGGLAFLEANINPLFAASLTEWSAFLIPLICTLGGGIAWLLKRSDDKLDKRLCEAEEARKKAEQGMNECHLEREKIAARVTSLEASLASDAPQWRRSSDGVVLFVNFEFVRLFLAPFGYKASDVIHKKFSDLDKFSPEMIEVLNKMDEEVLQVGYSSRHGVPVHNGMTAAILKVSSKSSANDVIFVAYAVPEFHISGSTQE